MARLASVTFDVSRAFEGQAIGIALTGMVIVFVVLALIAIFISLLPRILEAVARVIPEQFEPAHAREPKSGIPDEDAIVAALGFILHMEIQQRSSDD